MFFESLSTVIMITVLVSGQKLQSPSGENQCKSPKMVQSLLADDAVAHSPFYVIALPRTTATEQIDNICYTYFGDGKPLFFHVMSITFKDGNNTYHTILKGDVLKNKGLVRAVGVSDSDCIYHDHTLSTLCNYQVFVLYRCFIKGNCKDIDIGVTPEVDVLVALAGSPSISEKCREETETTLKNTSEFDGGDYVILPQKLKPQCVTRFNSGKTIISNGINRALGSKEGLGYINGRLAENKVREFLNGL